MFDSKVLKTELTCHTGGASQSEYRWEGEEGSSRNPDRQSSGQIVPGDSLLRD